MLAEETIISAIFYSQVFVQFLVVLSCISVLTQPRQLRKRVECVYINIERRIVCTKFGGFNWK